MMVTTEEVVLARLCFARWTKKGLGVEVEELWIWDTTTYNGGARVIKKTGRGGKYSSHKHADTWASTASLDTRGSGDTVWEYWTLLHNARGAKDVGAILEMSNHSLQVALTLPYCHRRALS